MENRNNKASYSEFISKWYKDRGEQLKEIQKRIAGLDIKENDSSNVQHKILEALFILDRQYVGGIHELVLKIERYSKYKNYMTRIPRVICETLKSNTERFRADIAYAWFLRRLIKNRSYLSEWEKIKKTWGHLFVPDAFYPDIAKPENIKRWEREFVRFYISNGKRGVEDLFKQIGNFLARFNIDAVYNKYPIYYYTLKYSNIVETDELGRVYKIFKFPLRDSFSSIQHDLNIMNKQLEREIYGQDLEVKSVHLFYKYSWGEKIEEGNYFKVGTDSYDKLRKPFRFRRNEIIRKYYKMLKKRKLSDLEAYRRIAKRFSKSESTIRHIIKRHLKI